MVEPSRSVHVVEMRKEEWMHFTTEQILSLASGSVLTKASTAPTARNTVSLPWIPCNEHYINHSADTCPLDNMPFFKGRLVTYLADKHGPNVRAASQLSAFE